MEEHHNKNKKTLLTLKEEHGLKAKRLKNPSELLTKQEQFDQKKKKNGVLTDPELKSKLETLK